MEPEMIWIVLGSILMLVGLIGCVIPVLPGPPLSYIGLLLLQLTDSPPFTWKFLVIWLVITIIVTLLDYVIPVFGAKKYGGSKQGIWGAIIGLIAGIFFFPPIGIIVGPVIGALVGELVSGKTAGKATRAAVASFIRFLVGTKIHLIASSVMTSYFFVSI
jgi:hypothetical protein